MGKLVTDNDELVYQQDDGEITARFAGFEEKMELPHEGSARYKKIFHFLITIGAIYLIAILVFF